MFLKFYSSFYDIIRNFTNFTLLNSVKYFVKVYRIRTKSVMVTPNYLTSLY